MIAVASSILPASSAASPTPPRPITASVECRGIDAVLTTAPTPVITAQPNSAASANGRVGSTRTSDRRDTVAHSAKPETPRW